MNLAMLSSIALLSGTGGVASAIFEIFALIGDWIVETIPKFFVLFYSPETGLTIVGVLAVCSLGVGVVFLLVGFVQRFFHFRG